MSEPETHDRCAGCGLSCTGVRVVPLADELDVIGRIAGELGVRHWLEDGALRLQMGTCVFFVDGCQLHRHGGLEAKPRVCRQFPWVRRTDAVGVDPGCARRERWTDAPAGRLLGTDGPVRPLPDGDLGDLADALGLTLSMVADRWRQVPWGLWIDAASVGPIRRRGAAELAALAPPTDWPSWPEGADALRQGVALGVVQDATAMLTGAVVIGASVEVPAARRRLLAVWVRGLRS